MPQHLGLLVVVDADSLVPNAYRFGAQIVRTPLDLIQALETAPLRVVLAGRFARERCYAAFVHELAPQSEVVICAERPEAPAPALCYA